MKKIATKPQTETRKRTLALKPGDLKAIHGGKGQILE